MDNLDLTILNLVVSHFNTKDKLYIIKCNEYYKIGMSQDIKKRLNVININSPYNNYLIKSISCTNIKYVESYIHRLLKNYKVSKIGVRSTEWFKLSDDIIDYFIKIQSIDGFKLEAEIN